MADDVFRNYRTSELKEYWKIYSQTSDSLLAEWFDPRYNNNATNARRRYDAARDYMTMETDRSEAALRGESYDINNANDEKLLLSPEFQERKRQTKIAQSGFGQGLSQTLLGRSKGSEGQNLLNRTLFGA